jgi:hypothetical protein
MSEDYDFYEDPDPDKSVLGFIRREKRLLGFVAVFLLCFAVFSCIGRQMDDMSAEQRSHNHGGPSDKNPWSKDS